MLVIFPTKVCGSFICNALKCAEQGNRIADLKKIDFFMEFVILCRLYFRNNIQSDKTNEKVFTLLTPLLL